MVTKNGCYALSSRRNPLTQFKHNVLWNNLKMSKDGFNAGITDLGAFDEGFCAQLNSIDEKMVVCFDSMKWKNLFLQVAEKYSKEFSFQESKQLDFQAQLSDKDSLLLEDYRTRGPLGQKILHQLDPDAGPTSKNSYWRLLQNWSTCSQSCGGGTQTRQLYPIIKIASASEDWTTNRAPASPSRPAAATNKPVCPSNPPKPKPPSTRSPSRPSEFPKDPKERKSVSSKREIWK